MLCGLGGSIGAGKTTAAAGLVAQGWTEITFAEPLKRVCQTAYLLSDTQLWGTQEDKGRIDPRWGVSPRRILQHVGTELFRDGQRDLLPEIGTGFWVRHWELWYEEWRVAHPETHLVVSDVRFENELLALQRHGGRVIRICREGTGGDTHASESGLDALPWDAQINNDRTPEALVEQILALV